jgi:hypothetical protein
MRGFSLVLASTCLLVCNVADAQTTPPAAPRFDWKAAAAALDRNWDACLAPDQKTSILVEWAPSGKVVAVTADDARVEPCVAKLLRSATVPPFTGTGKMKKIIERTDCVSIIVRSDRPIPVTVDGKAMGMTPVELRGLKVGPHLVEYTTTNGIPLTDHIRRKDCGKTILSLASYVDPSSLGLGP